jgi:hypothetical protein
MESSLLLWDWTGAENTAEEGRIENEIEEKAGSTEDVGRRAGHWATELEEKHWDEEAETDEELDDDIGDGSTDSNGGGKPGRIAEREGQWRRRRRRRWRGISGFK